MTLRSFGAAVVVGVLMLALAGCSTVDPETAAASVGDVVFSHRGFRPTDVMCPSGVRAKAGERFDCQFTDADGKRQTAHLTITKIDGDHVEFDVELPQG